LEKSFCQGERGRTCKNTLETRGEAPFMGAEKRNQKGSNAGGGGVQRKLKEGQKKKKTRFAKKKEKKKSWGC